MERVATRRRRMALVALVALAIAAFAVGASLGTGSPSSPRLAGTLGVEQLAGQRIVAGLGGTSISAGLRDAIHEGRVAGVVLFAENLPSRAAGRRLISRLQAVPRPPQLRDHPLLIMTDQEGGLVKRIGGAPSASAREMGARGAAFSARQGRLTAANLRDLGIDVDLAPVLDVGRPGGVIAETERSFGTTTARVVETAIPFARGLEAGGVVATAKHFPGFGAARENTDFATERIDLSRAELRRVDEAPFAAFEAAGGRMVMLSTAIYPAFSDDPAAFTRAIVTDELRHRLGFDGVTVTDALETPAVERFGNTRKAAVAAARAGVDLLLYARLGPSQGALRALSARLRSGKLDREEFERSAQRVLDLRAELER